MALSSCKKAGLKKHSLSLTSEKQNATQSLLCQTLVSQCTWLIKLVRVGRQNLWRVAKHCSLGRTWSISQHHHASWRRSSSAFFKRLLLGPVPKVGFKLFWKQTCSPSCCFPGTCGNPGVGQGALAAPLEFWDVSPTQHEIGSLCLFWEGMWFSPSWACASPAEVVAAIAMSYSEGPAWWRGRWHAELQPSPLSPLQQHFFMWQLLLCTDSLKSMILKVHSNRKEWVSYRPPDTQGNRN